MGSGGGLGGGEVGSSVWMDGVGDEDRVKG